MKKAFWLKICIVSIIGLMTSPALGVVLKIATLSPEGSEWMQKMREGAKEIALKTDNRVKFKFYPGGIMGSEKAVLRKIRVGQLHGGAITAGSLAHIYPELRLYFLPMIFKSFEEVDYVRKQMDPLLISGLEQKGFVTFGLAEGGFAYVMSRAPVRNTDDLRNQKVWMPDSDITILEVMEAFDIKPISLPIADVRTSLQTGLIDAVTVSPIGAIVLQWHTRLKYLTDMPLAYVYGMLAVDRKVFEQITPDDQKIVRDIMGGVFRGIDQKNRKDNVEALKVLRKHGIQFVKLDSVTKNQWHEVASAVSQRLIQAGKVSRNMVNTLHNHLRNHRSQIAKNR
ncbi:MAG: TRAP transporter substrate-binding protein DctP [Desulfobacterales bacterium]